ncbi:hypothetical protein [Acidovorax sp. NCPPB 3576]|uniref:hypothetical protein n=1 Tax=Acidovorax sp. NCPPB 3576 TaxID=2940488 RepID=UPI00234A39C7|nr:hypothetical protein [Acidovorax sp. NCPPB 3576]WCM87082.1 hypothetical protein M5C98_17145 [Acidovorax sp. NCPPB 3576]
MMDLDALILPFGKRVDFEGIRAWFGALPPHRLEKPSDDIQSLAFSEGGIDPLFSDSEAVSGRRQQRMLPCISLIAQGGDQHAQFAGALPFRCH